MGGVWVHAKQWTKNGNYMVGVRKDFSFKMLLKDNGRYVCKVNMVKHSMNLRAYVEAVFMASAKCPRKETGKVLPRGSHHVGHTRPPDASSLCYADTTPPSTRSYSTLHWSKVKENWRLHSPGAAATFQMLQQLPVASDCHVREHRYRTCLSRQKVLVRSAVRNPEATVHTLQKKSYQPREEINGIKK